MDHPKAFTQSAFSIFRRRVGRSIFIYMYKRFRAFALCFLLIVLRFAFASAATLGPAENIDDLRAMLLEAMNGDVLLVSGEVAMDTGAPLSSEAVLRISSQPGETAMLRGLRLSNCSITFTNIAFEDSLHINGASSVHLSRGTHIRGMEGQTALSFAGSGALIVDSDCSVIASEGGDGVIINHAGGEFYGSIEGSVRGGDGSNGGSGVTISPLLDSSAIFISGSIHGGSGTSIGGHALNLYNLSGNAYVTVAGVLTGGSGYIGGNGIQLVSANDTVSVGISGTIKGGAGQTHGGSALILMNAAGSSSFNLSGSFIGGDAIGADAEPGTSLHLVDNGAVVRTRIDNCILEDGRYLSTVPKSTLAPTPSPEPTATPEPTPTPIERPVITPLPEITAPAHNVAFIITPEPPAR